MASMFIPIFIKIEICLMAKGLLQKNPVQNLWDFFRQEEEKKKSEQKQKLFRFAEACGKAN